MKFSTSLLAFLAANGKNSSYDKSASPSALSDIERIITYGILFIYAICAIEAPSISTAETNPKFFVILSAISPPDKYWSPVAIFSSITLILSTFLAAFLDT